MAGQAGSPKTPRSQLHKLAASASLKRVHFSPQNEEFYNGMVPQSSPTRAQKRPRSRGILKPTKVNAGSNSQLLSSDIDSCDQYNEHGLLEHLSSPPDTMDVSGIPQVLDSHSNSTVARVLFSQRAGSENSCEGTPSGLIFKEAVAKLRDIAPANTDAIRHIPNLYSDIYDVVFKTNDETAAAEEYIDYVGWLLDCLHRDINQKPRHIVLAAIRCLGCVAHVDKPFGVSKDGSRFSALLKETCTTALKEFPEDKAVCMAVVACICVQRVPATSIQPAVPDMVGFCIHAMKTLDRSVTLVFQCLTAIEALLRRSPATTRSLAHVWLFPVLGHVVSSTPGVRSKADDIIRQNIPWVSADTHNQEMDRTVSAFMDAQLEHFLDLCERLVIRGDCQVVARVWGMLVTICARQHRVRTNGILQIMQKCFNSDDTDVLVTALMQWRCLIYAFLVQNQLERHKCVKLIMTPILSLLASESSSNKVKLASVRCWATLVYALGENIGSHIDIVTSVADATTENTCIDVRETIARILASLLNRVVLPEEQIARFVVPKLVIGTTTLAASDGKALSTTRGPFSSGSDYSGDNTATLSRYVIGVSTDSPVMPVLTDLIVRFIRGYTRIRYDESEDASNRPSFEAFDQLCKAATFVLDPQSATVLADDLLSVDDFKEVPSYLEARGLECFIHSPLSILFETLIFQLDRPLSSISYTADHHVCGSNRPDITYTQAVAAHYMTLLLRLLYEPLAATSKDKISSAQQHIKECAAMILAPRLHSDSDVSEHRLSTMLDITLLTLACRCPSEARDPFYGEAVDVVMECISEHVSYNAFHKESTLSGKVLFKRLLFANDILLSCSLKSRLAIYAACRELCSRDGFWSIALSSVDELIQGSLTIGLHNLEPVLAICDGQQVILGTEEVHCKAFLYAVADTVRMDVIGVPYLLDYKQGADVNRELTAEEVDYRGRSVMRAFCSAKDDLRKPDVQHIGQLERVFCAIARLLCSLCASTDTSSGCTCILFDSETETADMLISRCTRLCEETKSENTKAELALAAETLTLLSKLKPPRRAVDSEIDALDNLEMADASPGGTKRTASVIQPLDDDDDDNDMEPGPTLSSSKRHTPKDTATEVSGSREDGSRAKQKDEPQAEKTVLQQLHKTLGQLESELSDTTDLGIDDLLTVQERICDIQQRLCKSMRKNHKSLLRSTNQNDSLQQSVYVDTDIVNPFAPEDGEGEQWGPPEAPSESNVNDAQSPHTPQESAGSYTTRASSGETSTSQTPAPLLKFALGHVVDRSKRAPGFTFDVSTNLPGYKMRKYTGVERNQIEFERLEAHLRATYPECLVPTLGPGTTVSKYVPDFQNERLVVMLLQQWLHRVSTHPILQRDYELRQFVEAPFAFSPSLTSATAAPGSALSITAQGSGSGVGGGGGLFSWGRPRHPRLVRSANPTPFEQHLEMTSDNLEAFQKNITIARRWHGRLARTRARLAVDLKDVGTKLVSVGVVDHNAQLGRSFKRLGKGFLHTGACAFTQSNLEGSRPIAIEDIYTLACDNVQKTMNNRQLIFTEHQVAERQLERKRQAVAVLRASSNISTDQAQETLTEFNAAQAEADGKRERAERVDKVLAADLRAFEYYRESDLRAMFGALGREQLQIERQALGELKAALAYIGTSSKSAENNNNNSNNNTNHSATAAQ
ncbi:Vacuolar protein sorting-associated protein 17 [Coemansia sp. IMI 209127]|nr:Vacuolar protein sorting-associated protein 17 [Coemansia sp. IMI 209127]